MPSFAPAYQMSRIEQVGILRQKYGLPTNPEEIPPWSDLPMGPWTVNGGFHIADESIPLKKLTVDALTVLTSLTIGVDTPVTGSSLTLGEMIVAGDAANAALADMANDNILSPVEKPAVVSMYTNIQNEKAGIDAQALAAGYPSTNYDASVTALGVYLTTLTTPVNWYDSAGNTTIVGTTFQSKFGSVYNDRQELLNAIYAMDRALANTKIRPGGGVEVDGEKYITVIDMTAGIVIKTGAGTTRTQITANGMAVYASDVLKVQIDHTNGVWINNVTTPPGATERLSVAYYGAEMGFLHGEPNGMRLWSATSHVIIGTDADAYGGIDMYPAIDYGGTVAIFGDVTVWGARMSTGPSDPTGGNSGDIYFCTGTNSGLWHKKVGTWTRL